MAAARARIGLFPLALGRACGVASEACRTCPVRPRGLTSDGPALAADAGDGTFDGRGTCTEHACGGACGSP